MSVEGHLQGDRRAGLVMIDMRWQGRDFSLHVQPKSRLHENLWRLKLGLTSSLGADRGCDCCKSGSRAMASCMPLLPGVHGPHPQAATAAVRLAARGSVHAVPPGQCCQGLGISTPRIAGTECHQGRGRCYAASHLTPVRRSPLRRER